MKFNVNNKRIMEVTQAKNDGEVKISINGDELATISTGDFVMLINLYQYIKNNDIQNDFINPYGKNRDE